VGDRAWALEDEVRGRANEKSGAKTTTTKKGERERDSGEETGVRGGSEAGHAGIEVAGFFALSHWRFRIPKNAIHPSNYLYLAGSLAVRFNRSADDGLLFVRVFMFYRFFFFLLICLDVHYLLGRWHVMSHGQRVCECLSHIEIS